MKQYKVSILKMIEKDNYDEGCDPSTTRDLGVNFEFQSSDLNLVKERIEKYTNIDLFNSEYYEDRLEFSILETIEGRKPTDYQIELWKKK